MFILILCFSVGVVSGLRAFMGFVVVSWAARIHRLELEQTWLAFLGFKATPLESTALGLFEFVTDQLPSTPSRKVAKQFIPRLLLSALAGTAIGLAKGCLVLSLTASLLGAVTGTYGGAALRAALAKLFGKDRPAAFIEDAVAIAIAAFVLMSL